MDNGILDEVIALSKEQASKKADREPPAKSPQPTHTESNRDSRAESAVTGKTGKSKPLSDIAAELGTIKKQAENLSVPSTRLMQGGKAIRRS